MDKTLKNNFADKYNYERKDQFKFEQENDKRILKEVSLTWRKVIDLTSNCKENKQKHDYLGDNLNIRRGNTSFFLK